jgi:Ca2+-binding EF-hand superfamily protein
MRAQTRAELTISAHKRERVAREPDAKLLESLHVDADRLALLRAEFNEMDANNSGTISAKEFKRTHPHHFKYFAQVDTDNSGYLDFQEFVIAYVREPSPQLLSSLNVDVKQLEVLRTEFNEMDDDKGGTVSFEEYTKRFPQHEQYFRSIDTDNSGCLDFIEYIKARVQHNSSTQLEMTPPSDDEEDDADDAPPASLPTVPSALPSETVTESESDGSLNVLRARSSSQM